MATDNPFRYVGEKLLEGAGSDLWPLAVLYFDPNVRGLKVAIASQGAELIIGHGRKIGVIMEAQARKLCKRISTTAPAASSRNVSQARSKQPPVAGSVEE